MDSPRLYDLSPGTPDKLQKLKLAPLGFAQVPTSNFVDDSDLNDLDSAHEVSFDLNHFIGADGGSTPLVNAAAAAAAAGGLFADLLNSTSAEKHHNPGLASNDGTVPTSADHHYPRGQQVINFSPSQGSVINSTHGYANYSSPPSYTTLQIKQESATAEIHRQAARLGGGGAIVSAVPSPIVYGQQQDYDIPQHQAHKSVVVTPRDRSSTSSDCSSRPKKQSDKSTDEYRKRRERNNIAVRKSREKAKVRSRHTEERVSVLSKENEGLHKRIDILTKELNVLRSLFVNIGGLPEGLDPEIAKSLVNTNTTSSGHYSEQ